MLTLKSIEEISKQKPIYLHDWANLNKPEEKILEEFNINNLNGYNILFASYYNECYSGEAFVLLEKDGLLFDISGSHCSCCGLEEQWEPQETTLESLAFRMIRGDLGGYSYNPFATELKEFIGVKEGDII